MDGSVALGIGSNAGSRMRDEAMRFGWAMVGGPGEETANVPMHIVPVELVLVLHLKTYFRLL